MGFRYPCHHGYQIPRNCSTPLSIGILFVILVVLVFVCFCLKFIWQRWSRQQRVVLSPLDPSILKTIPVFVHSTSAGNELECAVCLSEFEDRERGRVLPYCKHVFHVECIDAWFKSSSTCPICRCHVRADVTSSPRVLITVREGPIMGLARFPAGGGHFIHGFRV